MVEQVQPEYAADEAVERLAADYNTSPYESHAFPQSAPENLAAVAYLFGLDTPDISSARVLEIGCAAAGNVIPFAAAHPQAQVVGIDLSQVQIDEGRRRVQAIGLRNLELVQGDISRMDMKTLGHFDYIVSHGVYSWVPENVQDAILAAIHESLAPQGVAYVSYNVYPGWKAKEIVRDAMLLRGGARGTPNERVAYARGMIDFLGQVAPPDSVLAKAVSDYQKVAMLSKDYYLLHEELETFNAPCYFLEMLERAGEHELAYLAEATPPAMFVVNYGDNVAGPLFNECGHSQALLEQYLDFVVNRTFRQTLLMHAERAPQVRYQLDRSRYGRLHFATWMPPIGGEPRLDNSNQEYGEQGSGTTLYSQNPIVKAALEILNSRWPSTMARAELPGAVRTRLAAAGVQPDGDVDAVVDDMLEFLIVRGQVRYRLDPVSAEPPSVPLRIDEVARRMAEATRGDPDACTFNRWHETVALSPVDRHLLPLLDGTRDRGALVEALIGFDREGLVQFERNGARVAGEAELRDAATEYIDSMPQRLWTMKLSRAATTPPAG